jgi:predicted HD superfamily hydrolase involved in NAD metabolism
MAGYDEIVADLESRLPAKRFLHTLGVLETASSLAEQHGLDTHKAVLAALLHDCAKGLDRQELEAMEQQSLYRVNEADRDFPAIWHGPAGAYLARTRYEVDDPEVLDAIEHHTLGHANPSPTLRVLMASDSLEPLREYEGIQVLREAVRKDLRSGLIAVLKEKVEHVNSKGRKPHPRIFETIASLEAE